MENRLPPWQITLFAVLIAIGFGSGSPLLFEFTGKIRQITLMTDTDGRGHFTFQYFQTSPISSLSVAGESRFALIVDVEADGKVFLPNGQLSTQYPLLPSTYDYFYSKLIESPFQGLPHLLPDDDDFGMIVEYGQRSIPAGNSEIMGGFASNRTFIAQAKVIEDWAVGDHLFGEQLYYIRVDQREHYSYDFYLDSISPIKSVPEPKTLALVGLGILLFFVFQNRTKSNRSNLQGRSK